jgi:hypothetical protein
VRIASPRKRQGAVGLASAFQARADAHIESLLVAGILTESDFVRLVAAA